MTLALGLPAVRVRPGERQVRLRDAAASAGANAAT